MDPFFIRHKLGSAEKNLCDAQRIAIDFENLRFSGGLAELEAGDFHGAYKTALKYMIDLRDNGGWVFAEYGPGYIGKHRREDVGCIIARIEPQGPFESFTAPANGQTYQVTLKLDPSSIGYIRYSEFPVLLAIRPPYGTICRPSRSTYRQIAEAFFDGKKIPATEALNTLHPKIVEQLCVEYLRRKGHDNNKLAYCTLRPGKSLAIIDIAGRLQDERPIFAQVKNAPLSADRSSELASQLENFIGESNREDAVGVLFGMFDEAQEYDGPISFVNLEKVFQYFRESDETVLKNMVGFGEIGTDKKPFPIDVDWTG